MPSEGSDEVSNAFDIISERLDGVSNAFDIISERLDEVSNAFDIISEGLGEVSNAFDMASEGSGGVSNAFDMASEGSDEVSNAFDIFFMEAEHEVQGRKVWLPANKEVGWVLNEEKIGYFCSENIREHVATSFGILFFGEIFIDQHLLLFGMS